MLQPFDVVRYLTSDRESYYIERVNLYGGGHKAFKWALDRSNLTPTDASRLVRQRSRAPSNGAKTSINNLENRARLTELLGFDPFTCSSLQDVDKAIGFESSASQNSSVRRLTANSPSLLPCTEERRAARFLLHHLCESQTPICYDRTDYEAGIAALTTCLADEENFSDYYNEIVYLHCSAEMDHFSTDTQSFVRSIGIDPISEKSEDVIKQLKLRRILLVLCGTECFETPNNLKRNIVLQKVFDLLLSPPSVSEWTGPCSILCIGKSNYFDNFSVLPEKSVVSSDLEGILSLIDAKPFLEQQWRRFCDLRGMNPYLETGSRMKRTKWHYAAAAKLPVHPINVRMRAFFASNLKNQSFFDPTQGFRALAGMNDQNLPLDIWLFYRTLQDALRHLDRSSSGRRALKLLRYVSTGCYWVTYDALGELAAAYKIDAAGKPQTLISAMNVDTILKDDGPFYEWARTSKRSRDTPANYVMSIAAKSVIQDQWMNSDAKFERALSHYRIAKRLWSQRNSPEWLTKEFPFRPHWERDRIYLYAETIRHLIRTCADAKIHSDRRTPDDVDFPRPPDPEQGACDPKEVINFCYRNLYHEGLNENSKGQQSKKLTRNHGAYSLAKELLQMMSDPSKGFGHPHPHLYDARKPQFIEDCGFTALSVGDLAVAISCFERLVESHRDTGNDIGGINALMSLSLAFSVAGKLTDASAALDIVDAELSDEDKTLLPRHIKAAKNRLAVRRASLSYLSNTKDRSEVRQEFFSLDEKGLLKESEILRNYISIMETNPNINTIIDEMPRSLKTKYDPFARCITAVLEASSSGRHHDAIGLKISQAILLRRRNLLFPGEAILDQVYSDILKFGCAERTFLRFLLEAGHNLIAQGHHYRAFCVYLRRCQRRAEARGFAREEAGAREAGILALEKAREDLIHLNQDDWEKYLNEQRLEEEAHLEHDPLPTRSQNYQDPLYGFSMREDYGNSRWLKSISEIDDQISDLRSC